MCKDRYKNCANASPSRPILRSFWPFTARARPYDLLMPLLLCHLERVLAGASVRLRGHMRAIHLPHCVLHQRQLGTLDPMDTVDGTAIKSRVEFLTMICPLRDHACAPMNRFNCEAIRGAVDTILRFCFLFVCFFSAGIGRIAHELKLAVSYWRARHVGRGDSINNHRLHHRAA